MRNPGLSCNARDLPGACRVAVGIALGLVALLANSAIYAAGVASPALAGFSQQGASTAVKYVQAWIADSGDNHRTPYLIVDKVNARVFAFDARGDFLGAEPVLLGLGRGDSITAGTGNQTLSTIRPQDRATPAGRYVAALDLDVRGKPILLIDYGASIALHPVVTNNPSERRVQRLGSATSDDNRISYGCINVSLKFFNDVVSPLFTRIGGVVYILPERGKASETFGSYDVDPGVSRRTATQP